jgi:hypothetical protein
MTLALLGSFSLTVTPGSAAPADIAIPEPPPPDGAGIPVPLPAVMQSSCDDLPDLLASALRAGQEIASCITVEPGDALPATTMADPVPPPKECGTQGYYMMTRFWICGVFLSRLNFIDTRTGATVGTLEFGIVDYSYSSNNIANWMHQVQWDFHGATGYGLTAPQTISGRATCSPSCYLNTLDFPTQSAAVGRQASAQALNTTTATATGAIGRSTATTYFHFNGANGQSTESWVRAPAIRCDNAVPGNIGPGCVFENYVPTLQYSRSGARGQIAAHIAQAQASGLPGTAAAPLHRLTNSTQVSNNRNTACGTPPPAPLAPSTNSCDEYPFASTYEGAWTGGGSARTQGGCYYVIVNPSTGSSGYSICSLDGAQNSGAGSDLNGFYLRNRVIDRDAFKVQITA